MVLDLTDERHPTLFKDVRFYIWPTRWAKPSEELARFIRVSRACGHYLALCDALLSGKEASVMIGTRWI